MDKFEMTRFLFLSLILCSINFLNISKAQETIPRIAISIDDPNTSDSPLLAWEYRNENIITMLKKYGLQAALFVCGKRIDSNEGSILISKWNEEGHLICNHSYSHLYLNSNKVSMEMYKADFLKCDSLLQNYSNFTKLFRYPFLKEGNTVEKRDEFRIFLNNYGYKNGYVSVDASDWYIDSRMIDKLNIDSSIDLTPYKNFFLEHIYERALYYDKLAKEITGRQVDHVLLLHHNLLNSLFLEDLIIMFKAKGWAVINVSDAYSDKIYSELPDILPAGESIIWALAKQTGKYDKELRYPGEDSEYEKDKMDKLGL